MTPITVKAALIITLGIFLLFLVIFTFGLSWQEALVLGITIILTIQGLFFTITMLYSWREPQGLLRVTPPRLIFGRPRRKFSLLIPARFEEKVLGETLAACAAINYPSDQFEVIAICRTDDQGTISIVIDAIKNLKHLNLRLVTYDGFPINKPKYLNVGIKETQFPFVGVFDAEDQPHPDLLRAIDTFLDYNPKTDVVQSGIQLVNIQSSWFSALACLEYYFWFKSVLPMFSFLGSTPLGGNTVFFKKYALDKVGGWDESCLTEDADIGIRLAAAGFQTRMIYDGALATLEETPPTAEAFIRQRTRWIQGYLQTLKKGFWIEQESPIKILLSLYLLLQPVMHEILAFLFILGPVMTIFLHVPLMITIFSFFPLYFLAIQLGAGQVGLYHLQKNHHLRFSWTIYPKLLIFYYPYQFLISLAFLRAVKRLLASEFGWEKTVHLNLHREGQVVPIGISETNV